MLDVCGFTAQKGAKLSVILLALLRFVTVVGLQQSKQEVKGWKGKAPYWLKQSRMFNVIWCQG
jgi:hypothetical protein